MTAPAWTTRSEREVAGITRYRDDLLAGRVYTRHATSANSVMGYRPPATRGEFGRVVEALGIYASESDRRAATAYAILPRLPLYGDSGQLTAAFWTAIGKVAEQGYEDVIGRTGPNAGRPSSYHHATDERAAISLALLGAELDSAQKNLERADIGWCLAALAEDVSMHGCRWGLPRVRKALETQRDPR